MYAVVRASPAGQLPGLPSSVPSVLVSASACRLLDSLRNGTSRSDSVIEVSRATRVRCEAGVVPSTVPPAIATCCRFSSSRKTAAA